MKRIKDKLLLILFVAAAGLFLLESVGFARATLIESADYQSQFEMYDIGVTLNENGKALAWRNYDKNNQDWAVNGSASLFANLKELRYSVTYPELLTVTNSGQIDEYVRVTVYKYWINEKGDKVSDLDLDLIVLGFTESSDWIIDENYSTDERIVLYYTKVLAGTKTQAGGETTPAFMETMRIDGSIKDHVSQTIVKEDYENGYKVITTIYEYDGKSICVDVEVDAIQTHNAEDAALSAWGRQITITDGVLSLAEEDR